MTQFFLVQVKEVLKEKNKVAIKNLLSKKRFAIMVNDKTGYISYKGIQDIQKKDSVSGKYFMTDKGIYIAIELNKD